MGENENGTELDFDRFQAILDAYGASPDRWPAEERAPASKLLARSADAKRIHAAAEHLDSVLDSAVPPPLDAAFAERIRGLPPRKPEAASAIRRSGFAALTRIAAVLLVGLVGVAIGLAIPRGSNDGGGADLATPTAPASAFEAEIPVADLPVDGFADAADADADGTLGLSLIDALATESAPFAGVEVSVADLRLE
ncbi:MAG: hypothetical protein QF902_01060 [Rhodospirillales bacterium]|jgi:hypothetical protein|nr:hypothetical protein [Rhodospirillales bacterium]